MGSFRVRTRSDRVRRILGAVISDKAQPDPDPVYDIELGHYYLVRVDDHLVVVRFDGLSGKRPLFSLAMGERIAAAGHHDILIVSDLGTEEP